MTHDTTTPRTTHDTTTDAAPPRDGAEVMRAFLPASPFATVLGLELVATGDGTAHLRMPFDAELTTIGSVVHGGAIAALADTTAMVAAWCGAEVPDQLRGATTDLHVQYLAAVDGTDLHAHARVLRRGRQLVGVEVDVRTEDDALCAKALATYRIG